MSAHDSEKLRITFELCESGERPAVVRYGDHCLKMYSNRIEYRGKIKYWKNIMETTEACKTYASVPLTSREKELARLNCEVERSFERSDYIHFPITNLEGHSTGHFYVSSSGVAWLGRLGRNGQNPKMKEVRLWAELDDWMADKPPGGPGR